MTIALLFLAYCLASSSMAPRRVRMVAMLPLILIDCVGSVLIGESFMNTLSAKAWDCRSHPVWGRNWRLIDAIFGAGHCQMQWIRELHQSVWAGWLADFKKGA